MMATSQNLVTGMPASRCYSRAKAFTETSADVDKTKAFISKAGHVSSDTMIKARSGSPRESLGCYRKYCLADGDLLQQCELMKRYILKMLKCVSWISLTVI